MAEIEGRVVVAGIASGVVTKLGEPLSFWGGLDPATGTIIGRHPSAGRSVAGRILAMPSGRGSSSSPSVLAEAIRMGTAPAAIILAEPDAMVALGSLVAAELYGLECPVVVVGRRGLAVIPDLVPAEIGGDGSVSI